MVLVVKLVMWSGREEDDPEKILDSKKIPIWIKANISRLHLLLKQRRKPKGKITSLKM